MGYDKTNNSPLVNNDISKTSGSNESNGVTNANKDNGDYDNANKLSTDAIKDYDNVHGENTNSSKRSNDGIEPSGKVQHNEYSNNDSPNKRLTDNKKQCGNVDGDINSPRSNKRSNDRNEEYGHVDGDNNYSSKRSTDRTGEVIKESNSTLSNHGTPDGINKTASGDDNETNDYGNE